MLTRPIKRKQSHLNQPHSYFAADLHLCFCKGKKYLLSWCGSNAVASSMNSQTLFTTIRFWRLYQYYCISRIMVNIESKTVRILLFCVTLAEALGFYPLTIYLTECVGDWKLMD